MKWYESAVFYHIYPIGYFGCPRVNDTTSEPTHKLLKLIDDIPHIKELGCNAIYFGPSRALLTAMTQSIIGPLTAASAQTMISRRFARRFTRTG